MRTLAVGLLLVLSSCDHLAPSCERRDDRDFCVPCGRGTTDAAARLHLSVTPEPYVVADLEAVLLVTGRAAVMDVRVGGVVATTDGVGVWAVTIPQATLRGLAGGGDQVELPIEARTACEPGQWLSVCEEDGCPAVVLGDRDGDGALREEAGGDDCDDQDPDVSPTAVDIPGDGVDQDCDGADANS